MPEPTFIVVPRGGQRSERVGTFTLVEDMWDDFHFKTSFVLHYAAKGSVIEIGYVKIATRGMVEYDPHTKLPHEFSQLGQEHFSLGQDREYYELLRSLPDGLSQKVLIALRDVAADAELLKEVDHEPALSTSLFRDIPRRTVETQFRKIIQGDSPLTPYRFSFSRQPSEKSSAPFRIKFSVHPGAKPPTNVHVLIGPNGAGKSQLMREFLSSAMGTDEPGIGVFRDEIGIDSRNVGHFPFANVVHVSFSAFDKIAEFPAENKGVKAHSVGLSQAMGLSLEDQFAESLRVCRKGPRRERWLAAMHKLGAADSLLASESLPELLADDDVDLQSRARALFSRLSSGHKIVALTVSRLVELVEERTLVLVDEPETHLHPPLLSALTRVISDLVLSRNGVAVMATHSPVVLQEVPQNCVHILRRAGADLRVWQLETESFGESVSRLTAEVFNLDVRHTGYHELLQELLIDNNGLAEGALADLEGQLGGEGRFVLQALSREFGVSDV